MYKNTKIKKDLIYPKLSYQIIGCLFEVFKNLGPNRREKLYQDALKQEFINQNIPYNDQQAIKLEYKGIKIGNNYLDFLIKDKVILEIKTGDYFNKANLDQVLSYLKATGLKLGIIANFTRKGVKFYRVLNIK